MKTAWNGPNRARPSPEGKQNLVRNDTVIDRATNILYQIKIVPLQGLRLENNQPGYLIERIKNNFNEESLMRAVDAWTLECSGRYVRTLPTGNAAKS